ncbi:hypothetical protein KKF61_05390 [Patescibacteria group bacterium]|nr:hypothetical protein [Patescibacteria group bacterium]MBU0964413.1 hypothetical protein [Patescibacteria group bacterium]
MDDQKISTSVKTNVTTGQKVLLVLAVVGLIGFGFAIALVSSKSLGIESKPVTYTFAGTTLDAVKEQMYKEAENMYYNQTEVDMIVDIFSKYSSDVEKGIIKCRPCDFDSESGVCALGACVGGHARPGDYEIRVTIHFDVW